MKIDKSNPVHWLRLLAFGLATLTAIALRLLRRRPRRKRVLFYGHRLTGNLLPIYEKLAAVGASVEVGFLTMDPSYRNDLRNSGATAVLAGSLQAIDWLSSMEAVVSDHGLHAMQPMLHLSDVKFFDVWHGIPFKGFDLNDFRVQRRYEEVWVASPLLADIYRSRFGFDATRLIATGYARTDILVNGSLTPEEVRSELGISGGGPMVLFAPTWQQDTPRRSAYPFGTDADTFLDAMSAIAVKHGATILVRGHLNDRSIATRLREGVVNVPFAAYPLTERLLLATDVLVCDWSSIAFDFLLLNRPAIFVDVPPPFSKGLTLDASWRFGEVVGSMEALIRAVERAVTRPADLMSAHGDHMRAVRGRLYGGMDDGRATERCVDRLLAAIGLDGIGKSIDKPANDAPAIR